MFRFVRDKALFDEVYVATVKDKRVGQYTEYMDESAISWVGGGGM